MTQELINKYFKGDLGRQLNVIYSTSDDRVFIRYEEALKHTEGKLDPNTQPLEDKKIIEWFEEFSGSDPEPEIRNEVVNVNQREINELDDADIFFFGIDEI